MFAIKFESKTEKVIAKWKKSNPILFKKLTTILKDIMQHPRTGIGHPEPLIGGGDITYSRRISAHNRIIYRIHDAEIYVVVIELEGHYDDK
ncbi:MAG: Txe/YoeB family addiction module toxin [Muribaculaceae bacterium]|nr:Txe/YoeB family addiction module toxin [Bacteroidales bacterium]MBD5415207.1 Txe/YoeB family addiction module toxin [Bacteroides sp.]MDE6223407.1 Txe/YoeB family addiction module toxin [Muribaculaceae bacterium]MDE6229163.1 Txe/YoeB family addiction module toxin [Muribaculaceae bacterium]MDE6818000.1 Txe/YoeB family addiction module toxin [Muribaculaceae bacterium]